MGEHALSNEAAALLVLGDLQSGDSRAIETYVSPDTYIQHNPGLPDGRDALLGALPAFSEGATVNVRRVLVMGDLVALHTDYVLPILGGELVGFDVFRFENGQVVEHWDNLMPKAEPNPSGRTQTDGAIAITDLDKTEANCNVVVDFLTRALINHESDLDLTQFINPDNYLQHNPQAADGLAGFQDLLQNMAQYNLALSFSQIHFVVAEGNFVLTVSEGVFGDAANPTPSAFYDLFRLEDGRIVEHWDVIAPIPAEDQWQNQNGKF
ncbi:MAG: nuclear transport factor 2 family protein [Anaerolineae bacterium]|nr:nuclear transport factor 2 family protein [Anaerolineae bacterium]